MSLWATRALDTLHTPPQCRPRDHARPRAAPTPGPTAQVLERCLCRARCDTLHVDCRWPAGGRPHAQTVTVQFPPAAACAAPPAAPAACHCHVTAPRSTPASLCKARPRRRLRSVTSVSQLGATSGPCSKAGSSAART